MNEVQISFQTLQLPPPYAYAYSMVIDFDKENFNVDFGQEYLNRDAITLEEITNEGFTEEDNFTWIGSLPSLWSNVIQNAIENSQFHSEENAKEDTYFFIASNIAGRVVDGHPANKSDWEYLMQELIQSIYEVSGLEAPFKMSLVDVLKENEFKIEGSFSERKLKVTNDTKHYDLPWSQFKSILAGLENLDFQDEIKSKPGSTGTWVSLEENQYVEIDDANTLDEFISLLKKP